MLHQIHINKLTWILNRTHIIIHSFAVILFLYHRATHLLFSGSSNFPPYLLLFLVELFVFLMWLMEQSFRWTPVTRSVFPENLPNELGGEQNYEARLPAVDVFICTADAEKEPTVEVMNTLISSMALDYPHNKLNVYISDDGGAEVTLRAAREAWSFATWWIPFCRKHGLKTRCPEIYFEEEEDDIKMMISDEFKQDRIRIKERYESFKERVQNNLLMSKTERKTTSGDHPAIVEVINNQTSETSETFNFNPDGSSIMPLLVYVAREKKPSHAHHFKAGALNSLLRVSSLLSNAPIILVLDCDMYCSDPTSVKQAICFHVDPIISPMLAFVQFPQRFRNLSKSDIYDSGLKLVFKVLWQGFDGLQGPILSGTGFFIKRIALCDSYKKGFDDPLELRNSLGSSNELIKSLAHQEYTKPSRIPPQQLLEEAYVVASCKYEEHTKWGDEVGFMYHSLVEDYFTGFTLHIKGWISIYCDPPRAQFLGTTVNDLNIALTQGTRWSAGLAEVGLSKFCPLFYHLSSKMSFFQRVGYTLLGIYPLHFLPFWCFATIPQIYLFHGISLYPKVSSSFFSIVVFIIISSLLRNMYEVLMTMDDSFTYWINQWRMSMLKSLTCNVYGSLDAIMKNLGLREGSFIPTNKVMDDEMVKRYQQGVYDFRTSSMFLVPLGTVVIFNLICFVGGVIRAINRGNLDEMLVQLFLSSFGLFFSWPVIEGMIIRKDSGRFPLIDFLKSGLVVMLLLVGSFYILP